MRCGDVEKLSTAYVDGELADGRASALRGHLRSCRPCRERVEDEARLVDAAEELAPIDPPPALWDAVRARIADEEIADGRRGRLWLWWQSLREHALPAAVGTVAVACLIVWLVRPGGDASRVAAPAPSQAETELAAAGDPAPVPAPAMAFDEARLAELERADARYTKVIADLRELAELEREYMTDEESLALTDALEELDSAAARHRSALVATGSLDPGDRQELYGVYREQIDVLRGIAMTGIVR